MRLTFQGSQLQQTFKKTNHKMHTSDNHRYKISIFKSDDVILNACVRVIGFDILIRPKTMKANMKVVLPSSLTNVHSKSNYDSITNKCVYPVT